MVAARTAAAKGGADTVVLEVAEVLGIVDWFVVTSGTNPRQVRAIAEEVELALKRRGSGPPRVEGRGHDRWVLLDAGDVVVHVFLEEVRAYYELERLWGDVPRLDWDSAASADVGSGSGRAAAD